MRIESSNFGLIIIGLILLIGSLSSCEPEIEKFQKTGYLTKRSILDCKCCNTEYLINVDSFRKQIIPGLIVEDSSLFVNSFPPGFNLPADSLLPMKVTFDYERLNTICGKTIELKKINRVWDDVRKKSLLPGTAHLFIDSLKNSNNKIRFVEPNQIAINENWFNNFYRNDSLYFLMIYDYNENGTFFTGSVELLMPGLSKNNEGWGKLNYLTIKNKINIPYHDSRFCNDPEGQFYFTEIDSINGYFSGKFKIKICDTLAVDSIYTEGFFYRAKVKFQ